MLRAAQYLKLILSLGVLGLAVLFFALAGHQYLNLEQARESLDYLQEFYAAQPILMLGGFFCMYVLMAALSLPGSAVLGLAAGALFGFWMGTAVVSFASSLGATLAFLLSRFVLRDMVQRRWGERLAAINAGMRADGIWYVLTLRLIPLVPFFMVNLLLGLTPLPARTFYWASQLGMLGGTMIFVNAGRELARLDSLRDIMSPTLLASFALLGFFPWVVKKLVVKIRKYS